MIEFLPLSAHRDPVGRFLEETEPDRAGASGLRREAVGHGHPAPSGVGQVGRWNQVLWGRDALGSEPRSSEGLLLRGECQLLQLPCPRMGSPTGPTSWEPLSP